MRGLMTTDSVVRVPGAGFEYFCNLRKALEMSFESGL